MVSKKRPDARSTHRGGVLLPLLGGRRPVRLRGDLCRGRSIGVAELNTVRSIGDVGGVVRVFDVGALIVRRGRLGHVAPRGSGWRPRRPRTTVPRRAASVTGGFGIKALDASLPLLRVEHAASTEVSDRLPRVGTDVLPGVLMLDVTAATGDGLVEDVGEESVSQLASSPNPPGGRVSFHVAAADLHERFGTVVRGGCRTRHADPHENVPRLMAPIRLDNES